MRIFENFNLLNYNAYRLNAVCAKAYFPENENDIIDIYQKYPETSIVILGNGNNVLLSKEMYYEHFIIFNNCFNKVHINGTEINAESGATMLQLSEAALENSLSGFEIFYDIPSSVGGAVVMNAGAGDEEIKDLLIKVRYLNLTNLQISEISNDEIGFEYRNSFFQKNTDKLVLKAWFKLKKGKISEINEKMLKTKETRWLKQPREFPNCGSVFKRPKDKFVGPMIEEIGLKGFVVGGAKISEKHAGFIVNFNNATGKDILNLIQIVQEKIKKAYGLDLEVEQRII